MKLNKIKEVFILHQNNKIPKKLDYKWVVIGLCFLMVFITLGFCSSNKGFYLDAITKALSVDRSLFSIGDSIRFITTAVVSLFFGTLVNKFGTKKLIIAGFICLISSMTMYSLGDSLIWFYIGNFLLGVGLSWTTTSMVGCIVNKWCKEKKGTIMGAVLAANGLGGALAIQIVGPIISSGTWGYRTAYTIVAAILLITAILFLFFFRENPKNQKNTKIVIEKKKGRGESWSGIEFSKAKKKLFFYLASFSVLMTGLVLQAINGVAITHMKDVGLDASYVALISSVHSLTLTGCKLLTGILYDRFGLRVTTIICDVTSIIVMIAIAAVTNSPFGMILAMFYGAFSSLALPLETVMIPIIASDMFGEKSFNQIMGIFTALNYIGYALGSPVANWVFDVVGTYQPIFIISSVVMLVVVVIFQTSITLSASSGNGYNPESITPILTSLPKQPSSHTNSHLTASRFQSSLNSSTL